MNRRVLLVVALTTLFVTWSVVGASMCLPCYNMQTGEYTGPECQPLSSDPDECEQVYKPCGCCPECAGRVGDTCHHQTPPCEAHLVCVNSQGEERHHIEWGDTQFVGKCQQHSNHHH